jgi:hypothetical protein
MLPTKSTITLTFGDSAENHVGMEQLGHRVDAGQGFSVADLCALKERFDLDGHTCELIDLNFERGRPISESPAVVLVLRNGIDAIIESPSVNLFNEQATLNVDKKAFMYGRVVNKHARWNLCFDHAAKEPAYEQGKGRVIAIDSLPLTSRLYESLPAWFGEKAADMKGEGNYYYDITKCGIGFHGDSERRRVIGVRLGAALPMHWQWFEGGAPVHERFIIPLNGGDIYVMSEKAVGTDWKKKTIPTLRHATGCDKFTTI